MSSAPRWRPPRGTGTLTAVALVAAAGLTTASGQLVISEYIEGSGFNKALEIMNRGSSTVELSLYEIDIYSAGMATSNVNIALSGTLAPGAVHVTCRDAAAAAILARCDQQDSQSWYNGNDAVVLYGPGNAVVDAIGQIGDNPGDYYGTPAKNTMDKSLCRVPTAAPDTNPNDPYTSLDEWYAYPTDYFDGLGSPDCVQPPTPAPTPVPMVALPGQTMGLFISEYIEGSSNNKALEIFNGGCDEVDLSGYVVEVYTNGSPFADSSTALTGSLRSGEAYVIAHVSAGPAVAGVANQQSGNMNWNGDDAVRLGGPSGTVDVVGQVGYMPATAWDNGLTTATRDRTLRRKLTAAPDTDETNPYTPSEEFDGWPLDTFDGLGAHGYTPDCPTPAPPPTPVPPTPVPPTPEPPTPAPPTPEPSTPVPPTPAPRTPAPPTPVPPTPAPPTPVPPTPAPPTPVPPTPAPPTPAPSTPVPPTPAPPTPAPATPEPPTPVPATPAPTPVPPTTAPATLIPATPQPSTAVPRPTRAPRTTFAPGPTAVPRTPVPGPTFEPRTDAPASGAATGVPVVTMMPPAAPTGVPPPTGVPLPTAATETEAPRVAVVTPEPKKSVLATPEFEKSKERAEQTQEAATGAAVVASVSSGAGPAMRLAAVALTCDPGDYDPKARYGMGMAPLQLQLFGSLAMGTLIGNALIAAGIGLLGYCVWALVDIVGPRFAPAFFLEMDAQGLMKFPSLPLMVFSMLYQGTTMAAMDLVMAPPNMPLGLAGLAGVAFCFSIPFVVIREVFRNIPESAFVAKDPVQRNRVLEALIGDEEWVSRDRQPHWVARWASVVRTYRMCTPWYAFLEFAASFSISAIQSARPSTLVGCGHVKFACGLVFLLLLGLEVCLWPHIIWRNDVLDALMLFGQTTAMFAYAYAYYTNNPGSKVFEIGGMMLFYTVIVLLTRTALDVVAWVYVFVTGRRRNLQEQQWRRYEEMMEAAAATASPKVPDSPEGSDIHHTSNQNNTRRARSGAISDLNYQPTDSGSQEMLPISIPATPHMQSGAMHTLKGAHALNGASSATLTTYNEEDYSDRSFVGEDVCTATGLLGRNKPLDQRRRSGLLYMKRNNTRESSSWGRLSVDIPRSPERPRRSGLSSRSRTNIGGLTASGLLVGLPPGDSATALGVTGRSTPPSPVRYVVPADDSRGSFLADNSSFGLARGTPRMRARTPRHRTASFRPGGSGGGDRPGSAVSSPKGRANTVLPLAPYAALQSESSVAGGGGSGVNSPSGPLARALSQSLGGAKPSLQGASLGEPRLAY